jgi:hypothetical protein
MLSYEKARVSGGCDGSALGGKIGAEESLEKAIVREIQEELSSTIVTRLLATVEHRYNSFDFTCASCGKDQSPFAGLSLPAGTRGELESVDRAEADIPIVRMLKEVLVSRFTSTTSSRDIDIFPIARSRGMVNLFTKLLVAIGSVASIGFGVWHYSVPKNWKWYSYIDAQATELVLAVEAVHIFLSLALVLFGLMNLLLMIGNKSNTYSISIVLGATCILWLTRVLTQIIHPQGSMRPILQYSMLAAFVVIFLCYAIPFVMVLLRKD